MNKNSGFILWEGLSKIDHTPIMVICTKTHNRKTGKLIQTWIMPRDIHPVKAMRTGKDYSVCGDCKHRPVNNGTCYVYPMPLMAIYKKYKNGGYPKGDASLLRGHFVRIGSWGDPSAVPLYVWREVLSYAKDTTGYTHQWSKPHNKAYSEFCMASVDDEREYRRANKNKWRTFRVKTANDPKMKYEFSCPSSEEENKRLQCNECMACNGGDSKASVVINVHGQGHKVNRFVNLTVNKYEKN